MIRKLQIDTNLHYFNDTYGFEENFKILRYSGYRESSISLYIDYGNLSSEYEVEQDCVIEDSRENRVKIKRYLTRDGWKRVSDVFGELDELREDIGGVDYSNIDELYELLGELGIDYTTNYLRMSTRGYSQGDYAEILVNTKEFEKEMGSEFREEAHQKWFDHYFWDSPISGTINVSFEYTRNTVNISVDEEFEFTEYTNDEYDVDGLAADMMINDLEIPYPLTKEEEDEIKKALEKIDYTDVKYPCSC